jgi:hypothetical protein
MAKEEAKIARKREIYDQRRVRILNAKARTMGLDVQTLDQQVAERARAKQQDKDADKFERLQSMEIERILAEADEEERQMKRFQMQQIKESWAQTLSQQKDQQDDLDARVDFNHEQCGPAAALKFSGEDTNRQERIRLQREQMRRWVQEQLAEKTHFRHLMKREEMTYAEMIKAIDEIRLQAEEEEKQLRKYLNDSVRTQNQDLAVVQRDRNRIFNVAQPENGRPVATTLDLHAEDKTAAFDDRGRIHRRDMFKGFTQEQNKRIIFDNQNIVEQKRLDSLQNKQKEYEWAMQQVLALRVMEQVRKLIVVDFFSSTNRFSFFSSRRNTRTR